MPTPTTAGAIASAVASFFQNHPEPTHCAQPFPRSHKPPPPAPYPFRSTNLQFLEEVDQEELRNGGTPSAQLNPEARRTRTFTIYFDTHENKEKSKEFFKKRGIAYFSIQSNPDPTTPDHPVI